MSEAKKALEWLLDCAKYFENRDTGGEDAMHWANVYNAENARAIAAAWTADRDRAEKAEEQADTFAKQRDVQLGKTIDATARAEKAEARVKVLEAERGWQPIETAPLNEPVIVWRQRIQGPCVAFVQAGISASGFDAIEPESGKLFRAEWWMPHDAFPTPPTNSARAAKEQS